MKYLRLFETEAAYNAAKDNLDLPNMSAIKDKPNWCRFKKRTIKNNEIWYTSSDGNIVTPYRTDVFGANIVSNTYENGKGIITFDGDVTSIGNQAFQGRSKLTNITIPNSVTSIGNQAIYYCSSLTEITIPDGVGSIESSAFEGCSSLTNIAIPDSVTSIGTWAFNGCSELTSVYCKPTTPPTLSSSVFNGNNSARKIYVPMESVDAYKAATNWSKYASYIEGYNF